ncbi:MAG: ribose 5-phosphate isomerase A [Ginsengibacter sp.]
MDLKRTAAKEALQFINDKSAVGLGAGSTMAHLVDLLAEEMAKGLNIKLFTSSFTTRQLLFTKGFAVQAISEISALDIYFDGCDQLDKDLNALKSGGGIHTHEKLLASMAGQFIVVGDESKYTAHFDGRYPLVVELIPEGSLFVTKCIQNLIHGVKPVLRMNDKRDGPVITANGNYLMDVWITGWPELEQINPMLKSIPGVLETSLFYKLAHKAILAGNNGVKILERTS